MKKRAMARVLLLGLSVLLLASCGNASTLETKAVTQVTSSGATATEEQPYEQYLNATEKIKKTEEQQTEELKKALKQLNSQYGKADELDFWWVTSPHCIENEAAGKSCIAPMLGILGPSADPILFIAFNYIGSEYIDMNTVEIHTDEYKYTYGSGAFSMEIQKDKVTFQDSPDMNLETALRLATDDDIDMLVDILKSDEVLLRFEKFNTAKPIWDECTMPEEDKQAITDALNAYYLYLNSSEMARAKAISSIEQ